MLGFERVDGSKVTAESVMAYEMAPSLHKFSEVGNEIPKSTQELTPINEMGSTPCSPSNFDVFYKKNEKEKKKEKSLLNISQEVLDDLRKEFGGQEGLKNHLKELGYQPEEIEERIK